MKTKRHVVRRVLGILAVLVFSFSAQGFVSTMTHANEAQLHTISPTQGRR